MWSSEPTRRTVLAGLGLGLLSACQFRPVYGPGGTGALVSGRVVVDPPEGSEAFTLAQELERRLGPPTDPRYTLGFGLALNTERIVITSSQDTNRYNLVGRANWHLTDRASGERVASGQVDGFTAYSATGTTVATQAAELNAADRLMLILSDKIMADLLTNPQVGQ